MTIVEAAVRTEKVLQLRLDAATDRGDQLDRENGELRQQLNDTAAARRVARREQRRLVPVRDAA